MLGEQRGHQHRLATPDRAGQGEYQRRTGDDWVDLYFPQADFLAQWHQQGKSHRLPNAGGEYAEQNQLDGKLGLGRWGYSDRDHNGLSPRPTRFDF